MEAEHTDEEDGRMHCCYWEIRFVKYGYMVVDVLRMDVQDMRLEVNVKVL